MDIISILSEGNSDIDVNDQSLVWDFLFNYFSVFYPSEEEKFIKMEEIFKSWINYENKLNTHFWCRVIKTWLPHDFTLLIN